MIMHFNSHNPKNKLFHYYQLHADDFKQPKIKIKKIYYFIVPQLWNSPMQLIATQVLPRCLF